MTPTSRSSLPEQDILHEAEQLICGPRNDGYGPAEFDFPLVAEMFNAWLRAKYADDTAIDGEDVAMFMVFMKLRRQAHRRKRDNLVDAIGYLALAHRVAEVQGEYDEPVASTEGDTLEARVSVVHS